MFGEGVMFDVLMVCFIVFMLAYIGYRLYRLGAIKEDIKLIKVLRISMEKVPYDFKQGALRLAEIQLDELEKAGMMGIESNK